MGAFDALARSGGDDLLGALSRQPPPPGRLLAYHGTPSTFAAEPGAPLGRFRGAFRNRGEGMQGYGAGHYVAENPEVAQSYRDALANVGRPFEGRSIPDFLTDAHAMARLSPEEQRALRHLADMSGDAEMILDDAMFYGGTAEVLDKWLKAGRLGPRGVGRMYEVDIPEGPFVDWDARLTHQPEGVAEAFKSAAKASKKPFDASIDDRRGGSAMTDLLLANGGARAGGSGYPVEISRMLAERGVRGVRYLDQGSRTAGTGTRNYVMFNDDDLNIRALRALLLTAGGGGAFGALNGRQDDGRV